MILKMILKSFDFQCDFDFQITTSKIIFVFILNHLYLGDLILILKSSTYDDIAHLCFYHALNISRLFMRDFYIKLNSLWKYWNSQLYQSNYLQIFHFKRR